MSFGVRITAQNIEKLNGLALKFKNASQVADSKLKSFAPVASKLVTDAVKQNTPVRSRALQDSIAFEVVNLGTAHVKISPSPNIQPYAKFVIKGTGQKTGGWIYPQHSNYLVFYSYG